MDQSVFYAPLKPAGFHGEVKHGGLKVQVPESSRGGANPGSTTYRLGGPGHPLCLSFLICKMGSWEDEKRSCK